MVLFAPVTASYFIFKSRKESGLVIFLIFLTTFSAVAGIEGWQFSNYIKKNKYAGMAPVTRKMIFLTEELKTSTTRLDYALVKLEGLSKVEARINEIKKTIQFIDKLRNTIDENQAVIRRLEKYTSDYRSFFIKKGLKWVFDIQKFYNNRTVIQHYRSLLKYLDAFERLLKYTYVNFYNITEIKSAEHLKNYDEYYLKYRRAVDAHNRFNVKRINFQNAFLKKYPEIKPYLPGERQTEAFKLWE